MLPTHSLLSLLSVLAPVDAGVPLDPPVIQATRALAPRFASAGTIGLTVWRNDGSSTNMRIGAARFSNGQVLDPLGLDLGRGAEAAVASDGTDFLAAWSDDCTLRAARVTRSGAVLDPGGFVVSSAAQPLCETQPEVAWNGTHYVVAWVHTSGSGNSVLAARVSPLGAVLDTSGVVVNAQGLSAALACDPVGGTCLVAWSPGFAARLTSAGVLLDATPLDLSLSGVPRVAWGAGQFLIVSGGGDVYGRRVGATGPFLDPAPFPISTAAGAQSFAAVGSSGSGFLVAWNDTRNSAYADVFATRVSAAGAVLDASGVLVSQQPSTETTTDVAWDGTQYLVAFYADYTAHGVRVSPAGAVVDTTALVLAQQPNAQYGYPRLSVWNGSSFFVAWADARAAAPGIYAGLFDARGAQLRAPVRIATGNAGARVAWNGAHHVVVWSDDGSGVGDSSIWALRVDSALVPVDAMPISVSAAMGAQINPDVACDASGCLVAWSDRRNGNYDVYASRLASSGAVLDASGLALATGTSDQWLPSVALSGTQYYVAWMQGLDGVSGTRVSRAGARLDNPALVVTSAAGAQRFPIVASNGVDFLVSWSDARSPSSGEDVYGARVSAAGALQDPQGLPISTAAGAQDRPSLAWNGGRYVLTWTDGRNASPATYGARVSAAGAVLDVAGVRLADHTEVALGCSPRRECLVTLSVPVAPANQPRLFGLGLLDNEVPTATTQTVQTNEDTPVQLTVAGTDADQDPLTFRVTAPPQNGVLSGTPPSFTYTPAANFFGTDRFELVADDGHATSTPAAVSLTVVAQNDAPVADSVAISTARDTPVAVTLTATDVEASPLVLRIVTLPARGSVTGTPPTVTYVPQAGFVGADSFAFVADDGAAVSAMAVVSVTVYAGDAGVPDAGMMDAGSGDAGHLDDGGMAGPDGGMGSPDGGMTPEVVTPKSCGCSAGGESLALLALALGLLVRRRR